MMPPAGMRVWGSNNVTASLKTEVPREASGKRSLDDKDADLPEPKRAKKKKTAKPGKCSPPSVLADTPSETAVELSDSKYSPIGPGTPKEESPPSSRETLASSLNKRDGGKDVEKRWGKAKEEREAMKEAKERKARGEKKSKETGPQDEGAEDASREAEKAKKKEEKLARRKEREDRRLAKKERKGEKKEKEVRVAI